MTEEFKKLIIEAYAQGYERGHDDTVEGFYTDSNEAAKDWLSEQPLPAPPK
jgi:hypothetical protein